MILRLGRLALLFLLTILDLDVTFFIFNQETENYAVLFTLITLLHNHSLRLTEFPQKLWVRLVQFLNTNKQTKNQEQDTPTVFLDLEEQN